MPSNTAATVKPNQTHDLVSEINRLKKEKDAVILAHYYQESEIQDLADFVGDSLELARAAKASSKKLILFAGVHFMAEGAKILNPGSKVIVPDLRAGCSLSDSCPPEAFARYRKLHPDHLVVTYINCSAAIKAQSDVIVTSSNAVKIVNRVFKEYGPNQKILFAPDRNLGAYVAKETGKDMLLWQGTCIVHETFSERKLAVLRMEHSDALVIAHPECEPSLLAKADFIGSTSALLKFTQENSSNKFIVATEEGILHQMQKRSPEKMFIPAPPNQNCACNECPFMKLNTMEKIHQALLTEGPEVDVPEEIRLQALKPLERMLEWSQ